MIVGKGTEDTILLENEMLQQKVRVKANDCIWGKKDADWGSSEWLMLLTTTASGAALGNMIGENFNPDRKTTIPNEKGEARELTAEEQNIAGQVYDQTYGSGNPDVLKDKSILSQIDLIKNNPTSLPTNWLLDQKTNTYVAGTTENGIRTISTYNPSSNTITQQEIGRTVTVGNDTYTIIRHQTINGYDIKSQTQSTTFTFHNNSTGEIYLHKYR